VSNQPVTTDIHERLAEILAIVRPIGWGAAKILQAYYRGEHTNLGIEEKTDGPVTAADLAVNHYILAQLQAALGNTAFAYLSEETYKADVNQTWLNQPWIWIIDPLDGTRDFIDRTGEYAIHIALVHNGRPVLAVVVCPETDTLYYATLGGGTFAEHADGSIRAVRVSERSQPESLVLVVSRTHRDDRFKQLLEQLPCQTQLLVGSVGCKIAAIVEQKADLYISLSGKSAPKDWDMAAPELILTEAGGQFTYFDGGDLRYGQSDVNQWGGLLASNRSCHEFLCHTAQNILMEVDQ
jgi:3'(2'), 5'-bisphosphate nucleotidase